MTKVPVKLGLNNFGENNLQFMSEPITYKAPSRNDDQIKMPGVFNSDVLTLEEFKENLKIMNTEGISILQLNVQGISNPEKFKKVKKMLKGVKLNLDIIVLGETKLVDGNQYKIENYQKFINCRNAKHAGGGVVVFIHKKLKAKKIEVFTPSSEKLKIDLVNKNMFLICYYRRSETYEFKTFMKDLEMELQTCGNKKTIITGDFNLDIKKDALNLDQYKLLLACYDYCIMNDAVTRNISGTIIDHLILNFKNECKVRNYTIENDISDHNMIISLISKVERPSGVKNIEYEYVNLDEIAAVFKSKNEMLNTENIEQKDPAEIFLLLVEIMEKVFKYSTKKICSKEKNSDSGIILMNNKTLKNDVDVQLNGTEKTIDNLTKSMSGELDPYIQGLMKKTSEKINLSENELEMSNIFKMSNSGLSCEVVCNILCKRLNLKFNKKFKKLNQSQGFSLRRNKSNKEIAACDLWQEIQEALDKRNNIVSLISLDIKNNFSSENLRKLFTYLFNTNSIKEELRKLHKKLKGTLFLYDNNYILINSSINLNDLIENNRYDMKLICSFLKLMNLKLNLEETRFMFLGTTKKKIEYGNYIEIQNSEGEFMKITKSDTIKYLDLIIDENKSWKEHINYVINKIAPFVGCLWKSRTKPFEEKMKIYENYIENNLNKYISIWGFPENSNYLEPLQWIQNMALRIVYNMNGTLCSDMFMDRSNQFEIYFNNEEMFLPIRGLYYVRIIKLIYDMKHGNVQSSILHSNDVFEPKKFRTLGSLKCLKCLGVILYNKHSITSDLRKQLVEKEKLIRLFLNHKTFKTTMDKYMLKFKEKY